MAAGTDWSLGEVEATVDDYLQMLKQELLGIPFNKAAHNRNLRTKLDGRSKGAIEFKHQNISSILIELGCPYIDGYKPGFDNYQNLLRDIVSQRLNAETDLEALIARNVERPAEARNPQNDLSLISVPSPKQKLEGKSYLNEIPTRSFSSTRNYLEIEARNSSLGLAGEELVLLYEQKRLWNAGARKLADKIEHVSKTKGDSLGYDILSFEVTGRERLIEVKTTRFGEYVPFFASRNEVSVSERHTDQYYLYRLFRYGKKKPRFFTLPGSLKNTCDLIPLQFSATPR